MTDQDEIIAHRPRCERYFDAGDVDNSLPQQRLGVDSEHVWPVEGFNAIPELGNWTLKKLDRQIEAGARISSAADRMLFHARALLGTPFYYETRLEDPPDQYFRVRLATFDCTTFVYTAIALAMSASTLSFAKCLLSLRYHCPRKFGLTHDPRTGSIIDFPLEALYVNAIDMGFLTDVTCQEFGTKQTLVRSGPIKPQRRHRAYDPAQRVIYPRLDWIGQSVHVLPALSCSMMTPAFIRSGDIVLLTERLDNSAPFTADHVVIADVSHDVFFLHATRHFHWRPDSDGTPLHTGIFYHDDWRQEQMGVSYGACQTGDLRRVWVEGLECHSCDSSRRRPLSDYIRDLFSGIMLLRPS